MLAGKDVCRVVLGFLVGLGCLGCHTLARRDAAPAPPATPPPVTASARPAATPPPAPLEISAPPSPPAPLIVSGPLESPPVLSSGPVAPVAQAPALLTSQPAPISTAAPPPAPGHPPAASRAESADPLRRLYEQAAATYATIPGYTARLRQREQVNGKDKPEEVMALKFRKEPWSVYFRWIGPEARGREVVYVRGRYDGKIHTRLAAGDVLLMPAGARFSVAPDSIMARGRSRHPITEAGIGTLVERFGQLLAAAERGDRSHGTLTYLGPQSRPEFPAPVEAVEHVIPPGAEAALPTGGRRLWFFAPDSHLPVLICTRDTGGHEVEYYCYDQLRYPVSLTDDDFNPDHLWARR